MFRRPLVGREDPERRGGIETTDAEKGFDEQEVGEMEEEEAASLPKYRESEKLVGGSV